MTLNVLIVDDSPVIRIDIAYILSQMGVKSDSCEIAVKALDAIEKNKYNLLICDTNLRDKNISGLDIATKFRQKNPSSKIIGMSSDSDYEKQWAGKSDCFWEKKPEYKNVEKYFSDTLLNYFPELKKV
jgi:DNA-binding NtrC family response regulator